MNKKEYNKKYYAENKEKVDAYRKEWVKKNRKKLNDQQRARRANSKHKTEMQKTILGHTVECQKNLKKTKSLLSKIYFAIIFDMFFLSLICGSTALAFSGGRSKTATFDLILSMIVFNSFITNLKTRKDTANLIKKIKRTIAMDKWCIDKL